MIFVISGPPAAGKSTIATELAKRFDKSIAIRVDDIRESVIGGLALPFPLWTEETARQYEIAETATAAAARVYVEAGFVVILDHCRNPENIEKWIDRDLSDVPLYKVAVIPSLETTLARNKARTTKAFPPENLEPIIRQVFERYTQASLDGWIVCQNEGCLLEAVNVILAKSDLKNWGKP